jgi:hypothetical protein
MRAGEHQYERVWGTALIVIGVALLGVVFLAAFAIVGEPGEYYDKWVPGEEIDGPEASFDWVGSGLLVEFTDTSEAGDAELERWVWDFGDGAVSREPNPSHRFSEGGEFDVTLEVVDGNDQSSKAEGTVEIETGGVNSGDGAIGLSDIADSVVDSVERSGKGLMVVLLVVGLFVVLTMIGGRLVRQGVRMLRPVPERISVKLRPKELQLAMTEVDAEAPEVALAPPPDSESHDATEPVAAGSRFVTPPAQPRGWSEMQRQEFAGGAGESPGGYGPGRFQSTRR